MVPIVGRRRGQPVCAARQIVDRRMLESNNQNIEPQGFSPEAVVRRFDSWAASYDEDRFGTSYGRYVHAQEERLLRMWLAPAAGGGGPMLGCGARRVMGFFSPPHRATHQKGGIGRPKKTPQNKSRGGGGG